MKKRAVSPLQIKIVVVLILVSLIPIAISGYFGAYIIEKARRQSIAALETNLLNQWRFQIKKFVDDRLETFELIIADPQINRVLVSDQEVILSSMLSNDQSLLEVAFLDTTGTETVHLESGGKKANLLDRKNEPAFLKTKEKKKFLGEVEFLDHNVPAAVLSSPVVKPDGTILGALWGKLKLIDLQRQLVEVRLGTSGYLYVVTDKSELLANSGNFPFERSTFVVPRLVKQILTGTTYSGLEKENYYSLASGQFVFGNGTKIPELGWAVITEWQEDEAMLPIRELNRSLTIVSAWTFSGLLLLSLLLAHALLRPIRMLQTGAATIGEGNFKYRIKIHSHDEIGDLAESFNKMAIDLKALDDLKAMRLRNELLAETLVRERELSKLKDSFISVSSHQLRTPLTSLKWSLELVLDEKLSDQGKELLQGSLTNAEQLTAIVEDLLLVSEFGLEYSAQHSELDLVALVKKTLEGVQTDIQAKKLELKTELPVKAIVQGDERALGIAIQNLVSNSVTYTKTGMVRIKVASAPHEVIITVSDTGIGIPPQEQKNIGQQFFRATNAIEQKNVGTGLGLFLVKTIVQGHLGTFSISSELGKGSTFTIKLPLN